MILNFVEIDLGDREIGMTEEGGDLVEVVAGFFLWLLEKLKEAQDDY